MPPPRRGPTVPNTSVQRQNSSQAIPRSGSKSNSTANGSAKQSQPAHNTPKSPTKKHKKPARAKKHYLVTSLSLFLLNVLALYAFITCPTSRNPNSNALCRSVLTYKHVVLDPYVLPAIQRVLSHPVAQPYVHKAHRVQKQVEPYVIKSVEVARPVAYKAGELAGQAKVVAWDGIVVPQFHKHVVPQYQTHLGPYVDKLVNWYTTNVSPHISKSQAIIVGTFNRVNPYVRQIYDVVQPLAVRIWLNVKPQLVKLWRFVRPYLIQLWSHIVRAAHSLLAQAGDLRKQYVDVHLYQIWEKAAELSRSGKPTSSSPAETAATTLEPTSSEPITSTPSVEVTSTSLVDPIIEPTSAEFEDLPTVATPSDTSAPSSESPDVVEAEIPSSEPSPVDAEPAVEESLASETLTTTSITATPSPLDEASSSSAVHIDAIPSAVDAAEPVPLVEPVSTSASEAVTSETANVVDDLFADLDDETPIPSPPVPTPSSVTEALDIGDDLFDDIINLDDEPELEPVQIELTPEEQAEADRIAAEKAAEEEELAKKRKKEETAAKRKDIMSRHTEWEHKLEAAIEAGLLETREMLEAHRSAAAEVLYGKYRDGKDVSGSPVRKLIDSSADEGEKLLDGLEAFSKKLAKLDGDIGSKLKKWEKAIERVKEKFEAESLTAAKEGLFQYYSEVRSWEINLILERENSMKEYANVAQTDVGLDYVWLDDVTYKDWQRYHGLMRRARQYSEDIRMIQNGTHAVPCEDPISEAMVTVQSEMEDIISGFHTALMAVSDNGKDLLDPPPPEPVKDKEPEVSILPIDPEPQSPSQESGSAPPPGVKQTDPDAFIGRGAEEVQAAFERAGAEVHVEL
ncbi:hypothetical protein DL96DRAFT_1583499 [Flagelloscypha sp. PMI_526]|nr:hypothetical protein DL96DRAFT_1583499 [Flagelloscypha sp. PMI_526]